MANGDPIIIGQNNNGQGSTLLERVSANFDTAFRVVNQTGIGVGIQTSDGEAISASCLSGSRVGIHASSVDDTGIVGQAGTNPPPFLASLKAGVRGWSIADVGVSGQSTDSNGVDGRSAAAGASGVYGQNDGAGFGVAGRSGGAQPAVWGDNTGTTGNGVFGLSRAPAASGVYGQNDGGGFGVAGRTAGTAAGVLGDNTGLGAGVSGVSQHGAGVVGTSQIGFGGLFSTGGSVALRVIGTILKTGGHYTEGLPHPDGTTRMMYAPLCPESWCEDFGRAQLDRGRALVVLDSDFTALLGVDSDDYHVFLTPEGDSESLFVTNRTTASFEVREHADGSSTVPFSYRIVAKRRESSDARLAIYQEPTDPTP